MSLTNLTLADFTAAVSSGEVWELQDVLESLVVDDRLRKALLVLKKELINARLQSKPSQATSQSMSASTSECFHHSCRMHTRSR
jgi:Lon-like ATP-dependent protease